MRRGLLRLSQTASAPRPPPPRGDIAWGDVGFGLNFKDKTKMAVCTTKLGTPWTKAVEVRPYGPLLMEPSATIINYGQGLFEGVKAHRTVNDRIVVFRGEKNGQRLAAGARAYRPRLAAWLLSFARLRSSMLILIHTQHT